MTPDTPEFTLATLTRPAAVRRRRRWLVASLAAISAIALSGAGVGVGLALSSRKSGKAPAIAETLPSPSWSSVFGDNTAAPATPVHPGDPASRAACDAVDAAGADGAYDPVAMKHVVDVGKGSTDPAIAAPVQVLAAAIPGAVAAPNEISTVLTMATAAINLKTACMKGRYIIP